MEPTPKIPFIPQEAINTQRVEIYLNDLKNRLQELRLKHDEVIHESVEIIQEIGEVGTTILSQQKSNVSSQPIGSIKDLIRTFESAHSTHKTTTVPTKINIDTKVDISKILENFEKLNQSHVLKESLMLFKRCKESIQKIDSFLGKPNNSINNENNISCNLKHKINMFNGNKYNNTKDTVAHFASCTSIPSLENFHSTMDIVQSETSNITTNSCEGYEGDNENSEFDVMEMKKKKTKFVPPHKS